MRPASCRDKGRGGVDERALCLSSLGCDHLASRNPNESNSHQDRHKAPTLLHPTPCPYSTLAHVYYLDTYGVLRRKWKGPLWNVLVFCWQSW